MNVKEAKICLDCEEIYDFTMTHFFCPKCGSEKSWLLVNWLKSIGEIIEIIKNHPTKGVINDARSI
jgi:anaerobic ribonucleoside-triphosphate reductase